MKLGTHIPAGERGKPIDIEVCRLKALSIHMFATRLSHLWCVTDFISLLFQCINRIHAWLQDKFLRIYVALPEWITDTWEVYFKSSISGSYFVGVSYDRAFVLLFFVSMVLVFSFLPGRLFSPKTSFNINTLCSFYMRSNQQQYNLIHNIIKIL